MPDRSSILNWPFHNCPPQLYCSQRLHDFPRRNFSLILATQRLKRRTSLPRSSLAQRCFVLSLALNMVDDNIKGAMYDFKVRAPTGARQVRENRDGEHSSTCSHDSGQRTTSDCVSVFLSLSSMTIKSSTSTKRERLAGFLGLLSFSSIFLTAGWFCTLWARLFMSAITFLFHSLDLSSPPSPEMQDLGSSPLPYPR